MNKPPQILLDLKEHLLAEYQRHNTLASYYTSIENKKHHEGMATMAYKILAFIREAEK